MPSSLVKQLAKLSSASTDGQSLLGSNFRSKTAKTPSFLYADTSDTGLDTIYVTALSGFASLSNLDPIMTRFESLFSMGLKGWDRGSASKQEALDLDQIVNQFLEACGPWLLSTRSPAVGKCLEYLLRNFR